MHGLAAALILSLSVVRLAGAEASADPVPDVVDVVLASGERIQGPLISESAGCYVVRQTTRTKMGLMSADRTLDKEVVHEAVHVRPEYARRASAAGADAAGQGRLARWCLDEQLRAEADLHAHRALASDPADADAGAVLTALGYVDDHNSWITSGDYLAAHDLTIFYGRVVTTTRREDLKPLEATRTATRDGAATKQAELDSITSAVARDQERLATQAAEAAGLTQRAVTAQGRISDADTKKKALDAADARTRKTASSRGGRRGSHSYGRSSGSASPEQEVQERAAVLDAMHRAQEEVAQVTQAQVTLVAKRAATSAELVAMQARIPAATAAAAASRDRAQASEQTFLEALDTSITPADLPRQLTSAASGPVSAPR